jgi:7-cyano-7-deazaguanine synthase in queuosine biosynthesis
MKPKVLISLSGGLDSAFVAWQHLTQCPDEKVLFHHVILKHLAENRSHKELMAVKNLLKFFREKGYHNFEYHESSFDYGSLPRIAIKDIQVVALFQAIILRSPNYDYIDTIKFGWHKGEVDTVENNRGYRVKNMFKGLDVREDINFEFPIKDMTRSELVAGLPEKMLDLVHSCRKPRAGRPICGTCKTCQEYMAEGLKPR